MINSDEKQIANIIKETFFLKDLMELKTLNHNHVRRIKVKKNKLLSKDKEVEIFKVKYSFFKDGNQKYDLYLYFLKKGKTFKLKQSNLGDHDSLLEKKGFSIERNTFRYIPEDEIGKWRLIEKLLEQSSMQRYLCDVFNDKFFEISKYLNKNVLTDRNSSLKIRKIYNIDLEYGILLRNIITSQRFEFNVEYDLRTRSSTLNNYQSQRVSTCKITYFKGNDPLFGDDNKLDISFNLGDKKTITHKYSNISSSIDEVFNQDLVKQWSNYLLSETEESVEEKIDIEEINNQILELSNQKILEFDNEDTVSSINYKISKSEDLLEIFKNKYFKIKILIDKSETLKGSDQLKNMIEKNYSKLSVLLKNQIKNLDKMMKYRDYLNQSYRTNKINELMQEL